MKRLLICIICLLGYLNTYAQHFYYRLDVATNNIYTFAVANLATAGLNTLVDDMLFDNSYTYTHIKTIDNQKSVDLKRYKVTGISIPDLFGDITAGAKLGYQSYYPGAFNWGIYGSAHYRINQFKTSSDNQEETFNHSLQRLLLGGGIFFNIGDIESSTKVIIEAGLRYETPLRYSGVKGNLSNMLNKGFSSHYAIRINGNGSLQGLGLYVDIPHYSIFKKAQEQSVGFNMKMFTFGFVYTITPWKIRDLYDI